MVPWADKAQLQEEAISQYSGEIGLAEPGLTYEI
jgi:hypothetical protein